jgi:hypothetical protein
MNASWGRSADEYDYVTDGSIGWLEKRAQQKTIPLFLSNKIREINSLKNKKPDYLLTFRQSSSSILTFSIHREPRHPPNPWPAFVSYESIINLA